MPLRLSREQSRRIDRLAIEQYAIPGIVLMENAAIAAAAVAVRMLGSRESESREILILCGGGNNGGDGLAIGRHLHNLGHRVRIAFTIDPARYNGDALINYRIVQAMQLPTGPAEPSAIAVSLAHLIIDAIFGTGLSLAPRDPFPAIADAVARAGRPVLAIDIPSGLDADTGLPLRQDFCIHATETITFVAEKIGFAAPEAHPYLGAVSVAPIGCPPELIAQIQVHP